MKGSASGTQRKLDVNGPLYFYNLVLGAIPPTYRATYTVPSIPTPVVAGAGELSFLGCIQRLKVNGVLLPLSAAVAGSCNLPVLNF